MTMCIVCLSEGQFLYWFACLYPFCQLLRFCRQLVLVCVSSYILDIQKRDFSLSLFVLHSLSSSNTQSYVSHFYILAITQQFILVITFTFLSLKVVFPNKRFAIVLCSLYFVPSFCRSICLSDFLICVLVFVCSFVSLFVTSFGQLDLCSLKIRYLLVFVQ